MTKIFFIVYGLAMLAVGVTSGYFYAHWEEAREPRVVLETTVPSEYRFLLEVEAKDGWHYINRRNNANTGYVPALRVAETCQLMSYDGRRWNPLPTLSHGEDIQLVPSTSPAQKKP
jgi:hypothetical protein